MPTLGNDWVRLVVYERRTHALVKGTIADLRDDYAFVPEVGSTILAVGADLPPDAANPVYNASGFGQDLVKHKLKRVFLDTQPSNQTNLTTKSGLRVVLFAQFKTGLNYEEPFWRARKFGDHLEFGGLSARGEFLPEVGLPMVTATEVPRPVRRLGGAKYNVIYNTPQSRSGFDDVYELRSGRLLCGRLHASGTFVPEVGSTVRAFRDFDPATDTRRIYNLPGVLVRDATPAPKK